MATANRATIRSATGALPTATGPRSPEMRSLHHRASIPAMGYLQLGTEECVQLFKERLGGADHATIAWHLVVGVEDSAALEENSSLGLNSTEKRRVDQREIGDDTTVDQLMPLVRCHQLEFGGGEPLFVSHGRHGCPCHASPDGHLSLPRSQRGEVRTTTMRLWDTWSWRESNPRPSGSNRP